jgi:hypothetical protein
MAWAPLAALVWALAYGSVQVWWEFQARPATALQGNGRRLVAADTDSDARP